MLRIQSMPKRSGGLQMRQIKRVTSRKVRNEWQIATTFCGLYNPIAYYSTKEAAIEYAKNKGWKIIVEDEHTQTTRP